MTPNAAPSSSGPSRRSFLASTAVATAAVAGGMPLLAACGGSDGGSRDGTTSSKDAKKILPAYVASNVVTPDIPSKNGSAVGFTSKLDLAGLKTSVPKKLGKGGKGGTLTIGASGEQTRGAERISDPVLQVVAITPLGDRCPGRSAF